MKRNPSKKKKQPSLEQRFATALRNEWRRYSPERKEALRRRKVKGIANGFICEGCECLVVKPDVDHIRCLGPIPYSKNADESVDWNVWIDRLTVSSSGLRIYCKICHQSKTNDDRENKWL